MKKQEKTYLVIWHYMVYYGTNEIKANSKEEALEFHLFKNRKDIALYVVEKKDVLIKPKKVKEI